MNTIKVKKYSDIIEEYEAATAITPGMLLEFNSAGKVGVHSTASGLAERIFALEDELQGKGIDDDYAVEDRVQCWFAGRGDQVYAIVGDGQTIAVGDFLESLGDGTLQKAATPGASVVGVALEAADTSGALTSARIVIRVI